MRVAMAASSEPRRPARLMVGDGPHEPEIEVGRLNIEMSTAPDATQRADSPIVDTSAGRAFEL